jgi:hypothetical protein
VEVAAKQAQVLSSQLQGARAQIKDQNTQLDQQESEYKRQQHLTASAGHQSSVVAAQAAGANKRAFEQAQLVKAEAQKTADMEHKVNNPTKYIPEMQAADQAAKEYAQAEGAADAAKSALDANEQMLANGEGVLKDLTNTATKARAAATDAEKAQNQAYQATSDAENVHIRSTGLSEGAQEHYEEEKNKFKRQTSETETYISTEKPSAETQRDVAIDALAAAKQELERAQETEEQANQAHEKAVKEVDEAQAKAVRTSNHEQQAHADSMEVASKHKLEKKHYQDSVREMKKESESSAKVEAKLRQLQEAAQHATQEAFKQLTAKRKAEEKALSAEAALEAAKANTKNAKTTLSEAQHSSSAAHDALEQAKQLKNLEVQNAKALLHQTKEHQAAIQAQLQQAVSIAAESSKAATTARASHQRASGDRAASAAAELSKAKSAWRAGTSDLEVSKETVASLKAKLVDDQDNTQLIRFLSKRLQSMSRQLRVQSKSRKSL